jgi:hypothetical protein
VQQSISLHRPLEKVARARPHCFDRQRWRCVCREQQNWQVRPLPLQFFDKLASSITGKVMIKYDGGRLLPVVGS